MKMIKFRDDELPEILVALKGSVRVLSSFVAASAYGSVERSELTKRFMRAESALNAVLNAGYEVQS